MDLLHEISKITLSPHVFTVYVRKGLAAESEAVGLTLPETQNIYLDADLGPGVERETLLHECLHGLWYSTQLERKFKDDQEEDVIYTLAPRILALLRDNPELVKWLTE